MLRRMWVGVLAVVLGALMAGTGAAQEARNPNTGSLRITVLDQTGAAIVGAAVAVILPDGTPRVVAANERGEALFEDLPAGKYTVRVDSPGFETLELPEVNVRRGRQERREVELQIAAYVEEVDVVRDPTDEAINDAFSTTLTQEQIDALPDDEEEMAAQLEQMAGPGAVLRVNGFSGGRLPPKSQIAEIRFRFDPYSAENHQGGFPRVDIRTRPGGGNWRNSAILTFRDESLNARNAFADSKPSEQARRYQYSVDGPIAKGRTSFAFNVGGLDAFDTETIKARSVDGSPLGGVVSQGTERINLNARIEHALTKNQLLRIEYSRNDMERDNLGVGEFELFERAYTQTSENNTFRISTTGPGFFGKSRNEFRFELDWDDREATPVSEAVTIRVPDAFTLGGAQVRGGRRSKTIELADNVDFALGKIHSLRAGVLLEGGWYRGDEQRNYNGTFTFASYEDFLAGRPLQFSRRVGDPLVEYQAWEFGAYIQDDIRVRKNLLVSAGLRYEAQTHVSDSLNFAPRLHVTWSPSRSGRTTIRAGAGIFHEWFDSGLYEQTLRLDGVRQLEEIIRNPTYPDVSGLTGERLPPSVTQYASDINLPIVKRASAGFEHALTGWMQLRGNYFVQRVSDAFRAVNINAPVNGVRPFPELGNITFIDSIGREESHGMDISVAMNYAPKRIFGTINYRLMEAKNDGDSATSLPVNGSDLAAEWGPARNDIRHRIFGFVTTPLAFGFRTNLNVRYESAAPYTITTGSDDNGDSVVNDRPAGVGRNSARGDDQINVDLRLSWSKGFGKPKDGGQGGPGGGPVIIRGPGPGPGGGRGGRGGGFGGGFSPPGANDGRVNLEIFTQISNLTNAVNYRSYSSVLSSIYFGQPTSAMEPRRIEVGMRVGF